MSVEKRNVRKANVFGIGNGKENIFVAFRRLWELKNLLFFRADRDSIRVVACTSAIEIEDIYLGI